MPLKKSNTNMKNKGNRNQNREMIKRNDHVFMYGHVCHPQTASLFFLSAFGSVEEGVQGVQVPFSEASLAERSEARLRPSEARLADGANRNCAGEFPFSFDTPVIFQSHIRNFIRMVSTWCQWPPLLFNNCYFLL